MAAPALLSSVSDVPTMRCDATMTPCGAGNATVEEAGANVSLPIGPGFGRPELGLNVPYALFEGLVALTAIFGNTLVIVAFKRERKLRRRTNFYIISLASADLLVGTFGIPFAILSSIGLPRNLHACLFTISLLVVLCTISIFCLVAVSIDRYWAILHPLAYSRNMRTKTTIGIISVCWLIGSIIGFLPLFGWHEEPDENTCLFVKVMDYDYLVFLYLFTIIIPAVLLLAFYIHIYRVIIRQRKQIVSMNSVDARFSESLPNLANSDGGPGGTVGTGMAAAGGGSCRQAGGLVKRRSRKDNYAGTMLRVLRAAQKREVKATQNLSIIVLFFMVCWMPLHTINCIMAFCPHCQICGAVMLFVITLSHLNSALNPLLYAYHLKDFREALKRLLLGLCGMNPPAARREPDFINCISTIANQHNQQHQLHDQHHHLQQIAR
ncbi:adenosine receptor A2a-like isoform X2 [Anopheles albimanus]|uniref:adenosine receptor A2a-like isoform X2 n=1 Tax=Anopheles albimanus TaxID=7167 RepID=UPI0016409A75|nr:adenosine receptor A2a-like isoform X2 [Anopheles albimanus]